MHDHAYYMFDWPKKTFWSWTDGVWSWKTKKTCVVGRRLCYCVEGGQVWGATVWRVGRFGVLLCRGWAGLGWRVGRFGVEGGQVWGATVWRVGRFGVLLCGGWAGLGCYCVEGGQVWGGGWAGLGWRVGRFGVLLCGGWAGLGCYSPQSVTGQDSMCQRAERSVRNGSDRLWQHADAPGRQQQDVGEGERHCSASHHAWLQGQILASLLLICLWRVMEIAW